MFDQAMVGQIVPEQAPTEKLSQRQGWYLPGCGT